MPFTQEPMTLPGVYRPVAAVTRQTSAATNFVRLGKVSVPVTRVLLRLPILSQHCCEQNHSVRQDPFDKPFIISPAFRKQFQRDSKGRRDLMSLEDFRQLLKYSPAQSSSVTLILLLG